MSGPPQYERGTILRCNGCGRVDESLRIQGHVSAAKRHHTPCEGAALEVVKYPKGMSGQASNGDAGPVTTDDALAVLAVAPPPPPPDLPFGEDPGDEEDEDDEDDEGAEEDDDPGVARLLERADAEAEVAAGPKPRPGSPRPGPGRPPGSKTGTGAPRGRPRGSRAMELRTGRTETVGMRAPYRIRLVIDVTTSTIAIMQAMFDDPEEFDFLDGTPSDFFDKVTEGFIQLAVSRDGGRYEGVRLVRHRPELEVLPA